MASLKNHPQAGDVSLDGFKAPEGLVPVAAYPDFAAAGGRRTGDFGYVEALLDAYARGALCALRGHGRREVGRRRVACRGRA